MRMMTIIMMMTIWQSPTTQSIWPPEKISAATSHHRKFQLLQLLRHWTKGELPLLLPSKWRQHIRILEGNKNPLKTLNGIYYMEYVKDISFWHYVLLWVIKCLLLIFPLQFLFWCTLRTLWEFSQTRKFFKVYKYFRKPFDNRQSICDSTSIVRKLQRVYFDPWP